MADDTPSLPILLERCSALIAEIQSFEKHLVDNKITNLDVKKVKAAVQSEENSLKRFSNADPLEKKTLHSLRSSNLPFYETLWRAARAHTGLVALQKRFWWELPRRNSKSRRKAATVDVVTNQGLHWIKVSMVSESKLLFDKAKAGWEADEYDSSDDDDKKVKKIYPEGVEPPPEPSDDESEDEYGVVELVKVAHDLKKASDAVRVQLRHPKVQILLPNIKEGSSDIVDGILSEIRATGAEIACGGQPDIDVSFEAMTPTFRPQMTSVLNLDCTILLALISDLSHRKAADIALPENPHPSLEHQMSVERNTPLLPTVIYPGLVGAKSFVASRKSVTRMWEIVETIGTRDEKMRAKVFFSDDYDNEWQQQQQPANNKPNHDETGNSSAKNSDAARRRAKLRELSIFDFPPDFPLPVEVVEDGPGVEYAQHGIPAPILRAVSNELSEINRSVFITGWVNGWTTVTSNRVATRNIESILTRELNALQKSSSAGAQAGAETEPTFTLPKIWTVDIARSLVGKEGGRAV